MAERFYKQKEEKLLNTEMKPRVWILVGNEENWETALQDSIWGVKKEFKEPME